MNKRFDVVIGKTYTFEYLPIGARSRTKKLTAEVIGARENSLILSGRKQKPSFGTAYLAPSQITKVKEVRS